VLAPYNQRRDGVEASHIEGGAGMKWLTEIVFAALMPVAAGLAAQAADPSEDYVPGNWYRAVGTSVFTAVCPDKQAWAATYELVTANPSLDWHSFGCIDVEIGSRVQLISRDGVANDAVIKVVRPNGTPVRGKQGDQWYVAYEDLSTILLPPEAEADNDPYRIRPPKEQ
jgi:hypothetical protein